MDREMCLNMTANFFFQFCLQSNWKAKKKNTIVKEKATINSIRYTYLLCIFLSEQWWKLQISNIT